MIGFRNGGFCRAVDRLGRSVRSSRSGHGSNRGRSRPGLAVRIKETLHGHVLRILPKILEAVLIPLIGGEQMHHHLVSIDHGPATARLTGIHAGDRRLALINRLFQLDSQRTQVRLGRTGREDQVIGDRRLRTNFEHA